MVAHPPGGYPGPLMSMREVPAPERGGDESGGPSGLAVPLANGPAPLAPSPTPTYGWATAPEPKPADSRAPGPEAAPDPGAAPGPKPAERVASAGRGARTHLASNRTGAARPATPDGSSKTPARSRRTVLYDDQTRSGPEGPPVEVRKVRRVLRRVDTWSLFRFAIMLYACAMLVFLVAAVGLWTVASTAGAIPSIEHFITSLFALKKFHFRAGQLFLGLVGMGIVWVLAATLFTTVAGVLYNLISDVVGGIELTVLEEEPLDIVG